MAQNRNATYGERWNPPSDNAPQGSFRNKTSETALDGSYLTAGWANDALDGWQGAMLHQASGEPSNYVEPTFPVTLNGNVDTAQNSQVYNAWYKKTQDVADGRIAAKQLEEKIAELQTIADGCYIYWYGQTNAFPANYNDFINFETKNDPSALNDPVSKSSNVTIDNDEITFLVGGSYSILFNVFADSTTVGFTTAGTTTKFFLNYSGNSPSTDTLLPHYQEILGILQRQAHRFFQFMSQQLHQLEL